MDTLITLANTTAAWDLVSFFENAGKYAKVAGGALLVFIGIVMLIWGGVKLGQKLMGNQQTSAQINWGTVALLFIVGGALSYGGYSLVSTIGSGGQKTITDLGGGTAIVNSLAQVLPLLG